MLIFGMAFLVCAVMLLLDLVILPMISDKQQQQLKNIYYSNIPSKSDKTQPNSGFSGLRKVNPNIVGWIKIPNTIIDFPVMQAKKDNPDFYLSHDCKDQYSTFGSIYADANSPASEPKQKSVILYGHTLNSGRMFTDLKKYKSFDFFKANPVITFNTVQSSGRWKIISVFLTNTLSQQGEPFNYIRTEFKDNDDYLDFIYQLRIRSLYNTGVDFEARDKVVLLSTCSSEFAGFRLVIAARKERTGETDLVDTAYMSYNSNVLYPDCWYQKYGGKKPVWPKTYQQAVKEKILP